MEIDVNLLLSVDEEADFLNQEHTEVLEDLLDLIRNAVHDIDEVSLKYIDLEVLHEG